MTDDPRTQLRALLAAKLRACCPACAGVDAGGAEAQHIREPEADYLADRLMELFTHVGVHRPFVTFGAADVDMRPHLVARDAPTTSRDGFDAQVRDALRQFDGTTASAVALLTGMTRDEIDQVGGVADDNGYEAR